MHPVIRAAGVAATVVLGMALVGCGDDDGRELRAPPPGATAPPLSTSSTAATAILPAGDAMLLASTAFTDGAPMPSIHTCDGSGTSPPLAWTGVPPGTTELVVTVVDPQAADFVHWVLAGIPPTITGLAENEVPVGAVQALNDAGTLGWLGPCPPQYDDPHYYVFSLWALSQPSGIGSGEPGRDAVQRLSALPGAVATLQGSYAR